MGNKRQQHGKQRRIPAAIRAQYASQTTRFVPRPDPPTRNAFGPWRRIVQLSVYNEKKDTEHFWIPASIFFDTRFGTTGFFNITLHRVSVWGNVDETQDKVPKGYVRAALGNPTTQGTVLGLYYKDYASTKNSRARVGFHVPSHLSKFDIHSDQMLTVEGDLAYIVELDATFY